MGHGTNSRVNKARESTLINDIMPCGMTGRSWVKLNNKFRFVFDRFHMQGIVMMV